MKSCARVNNAGNQNISSIAWKMRLLERLPKIQGNVQFPQNAPLMDLFNACRCPYGSIIEALRRPLRGRRRAINIFHCSFKYFKSLHKFRKMTFMSISVVQIAQEWQGNAELSYLLIEIGPSFQIFQGIFFTKKT